MPGAQVGEAARVVAELAHRDAQAAAVGRARDRPRVGGREQARADEAPVEVLPGAHRETVEATALHPHRPDAGGLLDDVGDAQVVSQAAGDGDEQAPPHDAGRDEDEEGPPVGAHPLRGGEVRADRQLVRHGEDDGGVRRQVHEVPPLVGQAPAGDADRGHGDDDEQGRGDEGEEQVAAPGEQAEGLDDRCEGTVQVVARRVAERRWRRRGRARAGP